MGIINPEGEPMVDFANVEVEMIQNQGPPPHYGPQQPPGYPPQYPPMQPAYGGPGMPPPVQPPGSYYPRLDIGNTLGEAFNLYKNNFVAFFSFWAIPAVLSIIIGLFQIGALGSEINTLGDTTGNELPDLGGVMMVLGLTLMFTMVVLIITMLFTGGIIGMTKKALETGKTDSGTGFDIMKKYFGGIIATSIVVGILVVIGFMLCCIPGILFCYWWMFAVTIVVVEGVGLSEAMSRSKQYAETRHTFWFAVVLVVVVIVISMVAGLITGLISSGIVLTLGFWPGQIVSTVIGQLFQWLIAPYATIAIAIHYLKGRGPPAVAPPVQYPPAQYPPMQYGPPPGNIR